MRCGERFRGLKTSNPPPLPLNRSMETELRLCAEER